MTLLFSIDDIAALPAPAQDSPVQARFMLKET